MCGIAGYIGPATIDPPRIKRCLRAMRHRGPDAAGTYERRFRDGAMVYLLHTRLSIIDLAERSNQPLRFKHHVLVGNAELYNYRELARSRGWEGSLRTGSDCEVLLRLLAEDGFRGLDEGEGMWALALVDESRETLLLARDRFGEKPLYLHRDAVGGLYFGSEIKFIVALLNHRLPVDRGHVQRFLVNGYKSLYKNGSAFFEGISELAPGTALLVRSDGDEEGSPYWRPAYEPDESLEYGQVVEEAREALVRSVELRLRADVPAAFLLSGGVDSNALVGIARTALGRDVHAFTIVNEDARYDERVLVEHSVERLGIEHTAIPVDTTAFLERLRAQVKSHDAPVYTITWYAQRLLIEAMSERGYKVSISGTGADELFSGYYDHHNAYLYEVRGDASLYASSLAAWRAHIAPIVRNPHLADPELFIKQPGFRGHIYLDAEAFSACLTAPWSEPFAEERYCRGLLRNRMLNELFHESVPPILHEDDHNAMSCSMENRSPYLDRRLFELCQRIPTRLLMRDGFAKAVLRDAARPFVPPRIVDERRKVGFNAPIASYLDRSDPKVRAEVLADGPIFEIVRREAIEALLDQEGLPNSRSKFLFYFLSARMFLDEFAA